MSIKVMTKVWEYSRATGTQLLLLLAIADDADDEGVATPKIQQLAHKCRQSARATSYQIATLQEIGELKVSTARGRGRRNTFRVTVKENMQKLHVLKPVKHAIQRQENMQSGVGIYIPSCKTHELIQTTRARARARGESKKPAPFPGPVPTIAQFTENYLDETLLAWLEGNCPAVAHQTATSKFIEYHTIEATLFNSKTHLISAWRGWMRNAQDLAIKRADRRAARKGSHNGTIRQTDQAAQSGESRNMANLRATVTESGLPAEPPRLRGSELVRAAAAKAAAAARAASERAIRESIDRSGMGRSDGGHSE